MALVHKPCGQQEVSKENLLLLLVALDLQDWFGDYMQMFPFPTCREPSDLLRLRFFAKQEENCRSPQICSKDSR